MEQEFQAGAGWEGAGLALPSLTLGIVRNTPKLPGTSPQQHFAGVKVY